MALSPGTRLGPYEVLAQLGAGGMGEVYRAHDSKLGRDVALKVLHPDVAADAVRLERFTREARAVAALNHPHIVTIYSTEEADGVRFMTMELVEGRTLDELIPRDGLPVARFLELALPLADALIAAHQKQITHRDLKPGNVMVAADGRLKVLDFGLARLDGGATDQTIDATRAVLTGDGTIVGTMPYMSPEQVEGRALDARSDLFSLGVMFYEMLTGSRPFAGPSSPALLSAILRDEPPPVTARRADVPEGLARLVARCLEKRPEERVQTARDIHNELRHAQKQVESGQGRRSGSGPAAVAVEASLWMAVLPFGARSADADTEALAAGLTEDITSGLSRFPALSVIAPQSARAFKDSPLDVRQIAERLGARYVLGGTVRKSASAVRIAAHLVDARSGAHLWTDTYDQPLAGTDLFSVQDEVTDRIVATVADMAGVLARSMVQAVRQLPLDELSGRELLFRGWMFEWQPTPDVHADLRRALEDHLRARGDNPHLWAELANVYLSEHSLFFNPLPDPLGRALRAARRAIELDPGHQGGWKMAALSAFYLRDEAAMLEAAERAIRINPRNCTVLAWMGCIRTLAGDYDAGHALARRAMALNPAHPGWYHFATFTCHFGRGEYAEALKAARRVNLPEFMWMQFAVAAACGQLDRADEGRAAADALVALAPPLADDATLREFVTRWYWPPDVIERLLEGVARARGGAVPATVARASDDGRGTANVRSGSGVYTLAARRVAVLPFASRDGDADTTALASGLTEDIAAGLARFPYLSVDAATPSDTHGRSAAVRHAAPRYLLDGTLRRTGDALRLVVRLVDSTDGRQLWTRTYDRSVTASDLLGYQDELTDHIVATVGDVSGALLRAMSLGVEDLAPSQLDVDGLTLRYWAYQRQHSPSEHGLLRDAFERLVGDRPTLSFAWSALAHLHCHEHGFGFNARPDPLARARRALGRALELDAIDQHGWEALALTYFFERDPEGFAHASERVIALNPRNANALAMIGVLQVHTGALDGGCELVERAMALNPDHPGWYHIAACNRHLVRGEFAEGLRAAKRINMPQHIWPHVLAARAAGELGRVAEAVSAVDTLLAIAPALEDIDVLTDATRRWKWDDGVVERMMEGYRKAVALREAAHPRSGPSSSGAPARRPPSSGAATSDASRWAITVNGFGASGGEAANALAAGLTEDIATGLSRFGNLTVLDRNARYVLSGSVRQSGEALRVTARVLDSVTGANIWADAYDRTAEGGVFALQDDVASRIVSTVADPTGVLGTVMAAAAAGGLEHGSGDPHAESPTVHGSRVSSASGTAAPAAKPQVTAAIQSVDDLSLAVRPFSARGGDAAAVALAEALTEDVTTGLSRFEHLRVLSRAAAQVGGAPDAATTGCRYALDGTVRTGGKAVRVGVRISDTRTSANVWAENFDVEGDSGIFTLQDDLAGRIVATVGDPTGVLAKAIHGAVAEIPSEDLGPEALMVLYHAYTEHLRPDEHAQLRETFERFLERQPRSHLVWALVSRLYEHEHSHGLNTRPDSIARQRRAADRALELDSRSQNVWVAVASAHKFSGDVPALLGAVERAVAINPLNADALAFCALLISTGGADERALELARLAMHYKPRHPGWYHFPTFNALYARGEDEAALAEARLVNMPKLALMHLSSAAAAGQIGRAVDARLALDALEAVDASLRDPSRARSAWLLWMAEGPLLERLVEGLEKALTLVGADSDGQRQEPFERPESLPSAASAAVPGMRVAVLPFTGRGGEQAAALADGLTDDITTGLSRFPHLRVVPAGTAATLTVESAPRAGVRYLIEGRVQERGAAVRVTVRLIDGSTGANLWADTFDRPVGASAFDVQDELASFVAATVGDTSGVLARSMAAPLLQRPVEELSVRELVLRFHAYVEHFQAEEHARLRSGLERALEREPLVAEGWACLADLYEHEHSQGRNPLPDSLGRQRRAAQRALDIDPHNQRGWTAMAGVHAFERDLAALRMAAERAIALNPLDADTVGLCALFLSCAGDDDRAMELVSRAMRLKPQHPGWYHFPPFTTHFKRREYAAALAEAKRIALPQLPTVHISAAAAAARAGSVQEAQAAVEALRRLDARFLEPDAARQAVALWIWDDAHVQDLVEGLTQAVEMTRALSSDEPSGSSVRDRRGFTPSATAVHSDPAMRVAVLPFTARGGDDANALAEGLGEEITTALARFPYLRVVSSTAVSALDSRSQDPQAAAERLGARFLLEGSVRKVGSAIRVSARLADVESGTHLWAETFDREIAAGVFRVQDELAGCITSQVADPSGALVRTMASARRDVPLEQLTTADLTLQFFAHLERFEPARHAALRDAFERALDREPNDATAWGCLSDLYLQEMSPGLNPRPDPLERQRAAAERAINLDATCQYGWLGLAVYRFFAGDPVGSAQAGERAIALNPLNTHVIGLLGTGRALAGDWEQGLALVRRALALNPHIAGHVHLAPFLDSYRRGDDEAALASAKRFNIPTLSVGHLNQAAAAGQLGRADEARAALEALRRVDPALCEPAGARGAFGRVLRDAALVQRLAEGFEKALALVNGPSGARPGSGSAPAHPRISDLPAAAGATRPRSGAAIPAGALSVAVVPFAARGGDAATTLAEGLSEEVATGLARFSYVTVTAPAGAAFRVEGSVRASGTSFRIAARLVDAASGGHLWADQFDGDATAGVLAVQDALASRIVTALADENGAVLVRTVGAGLKVRPVEELTASELVLRFHLYAEQFQAEEHAALRRGLEAVLEREARHASAWASLSILYAHEAVLGLNALPDTAGRQRQAADRGLALDSSNQMVWIAQAMSAAFTRDLTGLRAACERVVSLNPLSAHSVATAAVFLVFAGDVDRAAALVRQVSAHAPHHQGWYNFVPFLEAYLGTDYERALEYAKRIRMPVFSWCHLSGAAAAGQLGRAAEASASLEGLRLSHPHLLAPEAARQEWSAWFWQNGPVTRLVEGLEKALALVAPTAAAPGTPSRPASGAHAAALHVAVQPFTANAADADATELARGLSDDVTTGLSRFRYLRVRGLEAEAARNARTAAADEGAAFVLDGTVRRSGVEFRVSARLINVATGEHVWAEQYRRGATTALFELQDDLASRVVATLADGGGVFDRILEPLLRDADPASGRALMLRMGRYVERFTPEEHAALRDGLEAHVGREPGDATAWAALAILYGQEIFFEFNPRPEPMARLRRAAEQSVALDPESQSAWYVLAEAEFFDRHRDGFLSAAARSLELNPLHSRTLGALGVFHGFAGDTERGAALAARAMALNPSFPGWFHIAPFLDAYRRGDADDSASHEARLLMRNSFSHAARINMPHLPVGGRLLAIAAAGRFGREREARDGIRLVGESRPDLLSADAARREWSRWIWEGPLLDELVEGYAAALALAGAAVTPLPPAGAPRPASGPAPARPPSGVAEPAGGSDMRVAVLPLSARGGDDASALAEGLTDDLTTALARFPYLQLVARGAVRSLGSDTHDAGARLGARFLLEGVVRASTGAVRVSVHLSDAQTGAHVWAETFERDLTPGLFAVQDDIVGRIAATVGDGGGALVRALARRVHGRPIADLDVGELVLRYHGDFAEHFDPADHAALRDALEAAVAREPGAAPAWACLSTLYAVEIFFGLNPKPDPLGRLRDAAARANRLDPDHQQGWVGLATAALFDRDRVALQTATNRIVALNPFHSRSMATVGLYTVFSGETSRGVALVERSIALNPRHPGWYLLAFFLAAYERGDFEAALRAAKAIGMPQFVAGNLAAAAAAGQVGKVEEARPALDALSRFDAALLAPDAARAVWARWLWNAEVLDRLVEGLEKAVALVAAARGHD